MKSIRATNSTTILTFLFVTMLIIVGCKDDSTSPPQNDFSSVPAAFDTTAALETDEREDGLIVYVIKEGNGIFEVTQRDWVGVFYTLRNTSGEIFLSSYNNGNTSPTGFYNLTNGTNTGPFGDPSPPIPQGLREGLIGMSVGEKRTLVVPPHLGYITITSSVPLGPLGRSLVNDTLVYDVELESIIY